MTAAAEDIRAARFPEDSEAVLAIFREYVASPSVSLDYQGHADEFASLPGKYAAPDGGLLLAWQAGTVVGCAAWRRVDAERCELKRVYVASASTSCPNSPPPASSTPNSVFAMPSRSASTRSRERPSSAATCPTPPDPGRPTRDIRACNSNSSRLPAAPDAAP